MSDQVLQLSFYSCFEQKSCTHVTHECVEIANEEEHTNLLSYLSVLPQAVNEDCIILLGHEAPASQFKCLPMNAIGMHQLISVALDVPIALI